MANRAERKAEKKRLKEEKSRKLSEDFAAERGGKTPVIVEVPRNIEKIVTLSEREEFIAKIPKVVNNLKVYDANMTWCRTISDIEGSWSWTEPRKWSDEEWHGELLRALQPYTNETWASIAKMSTGNGKKGKRRVRHHAQEVSTLILEAQQRWKSLKLDQYETAYRFRLGGAKRAWGIQLGPHFYLVWFERYHKIYPVER